MGIIQDFLSILAEIIIPILYPICSTRRKQLPITANKLPPLAADNLWKKFNHVHISPSVKSTSMFLCLIDSNPSSAWLWFLLLVKFFAHFFIIWIWRSNMINLAVKKCCGFYRSGFHEISCKRESGSKPDWPFHKRSERDLAFIWQTWYS